MPSSPVGASSGSGHTPSPHMVHRSGHAPIPVAGASPPHTGRPDDSPPFTASPGLAPPRPSARVGEGDGITTNLTAQLDGTSAQGAVAAILEQTLHASSARQLVAEARLDVEAAAAAHAVVDFVARARGQESAAAEGELRAALEEEARGLEEQARRRERRVRAEEIVGTKRGRAEEAAEEAARLKTELERKKQRLADAVDSERQLEDEAKSRDEGLQRAAAQAQAQRVADGRRQREQAALQEELRLVRLQLDQQNQRVQTLEVQNLALQQQVQQQAPQQQVQQQAVAPAPEPEPEPAPPALPGNAGGQAAAGPDALFKRVYDLVPSGPTGHDGDPSALADAVCPSVLL